MKVLKILIIDDDSMDHFLYERWLRGHDLTFVTSKRNASRYLRHEWDLVICDYRIPDVMDNELLYLLEMSCKVPWFGVSTQIYGAKYDDLVEKKEKPILAKIDELGLL